MASARGHRNGDGDVKLSKALSWLLRHGAKNEGIRLTSDGFADLKEILKHRSFAGRFTVADVERVVANDAKQRYTLRRCGGEGSVDVEDPHLLEIKANQGHSVQVNPSQNSC